MAPGFIKTAIARNAAGASPPLPPGSPYAPAAARVAAISDGVEGPRSTPVDVFARWMVAMALRRSLPRFWSAGNQSGLVRFVAAWVPVWLRDRLLAREFGLTRLVRAKPPPPAAAAARVKAA